MILTTFLIKGHTEKAAHRRTHPHTEEHTPNPSQEGSFGLERGWGCVVLCLLCDLFRVAFNQEIPETTSR